MSQTEHDATPKAITRRARKKAKRNEPATASHVPDSKTQAADVSAQALQEVPAAELTTTREVLAASETAQAVQEAPATEPATTTKPAALAANLQVIRFSQHLWRETAQCLPPPPVKRKVNMTILT